MKRILWVLGLSLFVSAVQAKEKLLERLIEQQAYELALQWLSQSPIHPLQKDLYRLEVYLERPDVEKADALIKQLIWEQRVSPQTLAQQNLKLNLLKRNYEWVEKIAYQQSAPYERFVFISRLMTNKSFSTFSRENKQGLIDFLEWVQTADEMNRVLSAYHQFCDREMCSDFERLSIDLAMTLEFNQQVDVIQWFRSVGQNDWADAVLYINFMNESLKKQVEDVLLESCELGRDDLCVFKLAYENPLSPTLDWELLSLWTGFEEKTQNNSLKKWIAKELNQYIRNVQ